MGKGTTKPIAWSEFGSGMSSWEVGLNKTGFHHIYLLQDYARAYRKAARRLFEALRQTLLDEDQFSDHRDMDAHPIVFLYRHALEVYLKTIIVFGNQLLWLRGRPLITGKDIFTSHQLATLLRSTQDIFCLIDCSDLWIAPTFESFADVERVVRAVDKVEHDALRYPVGMEKGKMVQLLPKGLHFNVLTFAEKLNPLLDLLDAAATRTWDTFQAWRPSA